MAQTKILITGANGQIGRVLTEELRKKIEEAKGAQIYMARFIYCGGKTNRSWCNIMLQVVLLFSRF